MSRYEEIALACIGEYGPWVKSKSSSGQLSQEQIPEQVRLMMAYAIADIPEFQIWANKFDKDELVKKQ